MNSQATSEHSPLPNDFYLPLKARVDEIESCYRALTPNSAKLFEQAEGVYPGGYTRDAIIRRPYSPFVRKGEGTQLIDCDGRSITDFWFNATSLPIGHAHPRVVDAVTRQAQAGSAYFAFSEIELDLAAKICDRLPSGERIRFTNSGSEAVMVAVRLARAATGRDLLVKFEGSYHGTYDDVYWSVGPPADKVGDPDHPTPVPDTGGLPSGAGRVLVLPYNNPEVLRATMAARGAEVAAMIIEPMANRIGLVQPDSEFLAAAREVCDASGAVLIFDEVIAFRLGRNGAQGELGVTPDMTTLGKVIGGGFPVGGVVGLESILGVSDPGSPNRMAHAGTFNGNPVTAAAGCATLDELTIEAFAQINALGKQVRRRLREVCEGLPLSITGAGSLFKINATARVIRDYRDAMTVDREWERIASLALLNEGFMLTSSLHGCVSTRTTAAETDTLIEVFSALVKP